MIMSVDPLLEPANGPNYFPFDPDILYELKVDNNNDAVEDVVFQFRFFTEQRLPNLFQVYAGAGGGIVAPANSPAPVPPGTLIVPPQITSFHQSPDWDSGRATGHDGQGRRGHGAANAAGAPLYAVPANVGPRTMNYDGAVQSGHLSTPLRHLKRVRRHDRRRLLDRSRRRVRHAEHSAAIAPVL